MRLIITLNSINDIIKSFNTVHPSFGKIPIFLVGLLSNTLSLSLNSHETASLSSFHFVTCQVISIPYIFMYFGVRFSWHNPFQLFPAPWWTERKTQGNLTSLSNIDIAVVEAKARYAIRNKVLFPVLLRIFRPFIRALLIFITSHILPFTKDSDFNSVELKMNTKSCKYVF